MTVTTLSGREFNQDIAKAKRAAARGPVVIMDRGEPAFVLQRYEEWRRQVAAMPGLSLLDAIADPVGADIAFEPPRLATAFARPADLD